MKFLIKKGIMIEDKELQAGTLVEENQIPKKSKKWLLEQNIIEKSDGQTKPTKIEEEE
jgi:orotate phosphoribosyltransferase-like protein